MSATFTIAIAPGTTQLIVTSSAKGSLVAGTYIQWINSTANDCTVSMSSPMMPTLTMTVPKNSTSSLAAFTMNPTTTNTVSYTVSEPTLSNCTGEIVFVPNQIITIALLANKGSSQPTLVVDNPVFRVAATTPFQWANTTPNTVFLDFLGFRVQLAEGTAAKPTYSTMMACGSVGGFKYYVSDTAGNITDPEVVIMTP